MTLSIQKISLEMPPKYDAVMEKFDEHFKVRRNVIAIAIMRGLVSTVVVNMRENLSNSI